MDKDNDLRLPNGLPCIGVDRAAKQINIILPEGFELNVLSVDSGIELTTSPGHTKDRAYPSFQTIRSARREPRPEVSPLSPQDALRVNGRAPPTPLLAPFPGILRAPLRCPEHGVHAWRGDVVCATSERGCGAVYQTQHDDAPHFAPFDCPCGAPLMPRAAPGAPERTHYTARTICPGCFEAHRGTPPS